MVLIDVLSYVVWFSALHRLIHEYRMLIHPVIVNDGKRLVENMKGRF
jgi:hypothetical protein